MQNRYIALCLGLFLCGNQTSFVPVSASSPAYAFTGKVDRILPENVNQPMLDDESMTFQPTNLPAAISVTLSNDHVEPKLAGGENVIVVDTAVVHEPVSTVDIRKIEPTVVTAISDKEPIRDSGNKTTNTATASIPAPVSNATADFRSMPLLRSHLPLNVPAALALTEDERKNIECMAWNLYFEVRDGQRNEQVAVAYVPINRIGKKDFGNDVCTNVFQYDIRNGIRKQQFSWVGRKFGPHWVREDAAWEKMQNLAIEVYLRRIPDAGKGATYFHSVKLTTSWAPAIRKIVLGQHLFWQG